MLKLILIDYLTLCKPRVVLLMLSTAWVGMYLASPTYLDWPRMVIATLGIAFAASAAAIINHLLDRNIDSKMARTAFRPIASGRISPKQAIIFAIILAILAWSLLYICVNRTTAILTFASVIGYAIIYTMYLKRATPQNIVIGGLAGAMPPLLGWSAISNNIDPRSLILVLIIFIWTPPHFWALAIYRVKDYRNAAIPMLPVTHGIQFTKLCLLLYTILLIAVTCLPFVIQMAGFKYLIIATLLNTYFLYLTVRLYFSNGVQEHRLAIKTFNFSLSYLLILFIGLLLDPITATYGVY
jgi:heme o synthase